MNDRQPAKPPKSLASAKAAQMKATSNASLSAIVHATPSAGPVRSGESPKHAEALTLPDTIEEQVRQRYLSVVYTHKTHEKDVEILTAQSRRLKLALRVTSIITTGGLIALLLGDNHLAKVIMALVSLCASLLASTSRDKESDRKAREHRAAADGMWELRQEYESFLVDLHEKAIARSAAAAKRDELFAKESAINKRAPRTSADAYARAQTALKSNEEYTSSAAEIDRHLPPSLRKAGQK